ncbi:MAG: PH domain-containing protein [candidate division Zixibacteria bacterium]|nr:PH domain-containing protein [candidate division Zixibacteria bacterium]
MEIKPSPKLKSLYTLINFLLFLIYCALPVIILQIVKQHPRHLYDIWSLVIAILGLVLVILIQLYLLAYIKTLRYELSSDDLRLESGVFWKRKKVIPFHKITNLNTLQGPFERRFGLGHLNIQTAGHGANTSPEGKLVGLENFDTIKEEVMQKLRLVKSEATTTEDRPTERTQQELLKEMLKVLSRIEKNMQNP